MLTDNKFTQVLGSLAIFELAIDLQATIVDLLIEVLNDCIDDPFKDDQTAANECYAILAKLKSLKIEQRTINEYIVIMKALIFRVRKASNVTKGALSNANQ